jgi:hypothetical protein
MTVKQFARHMNSQALMFAKSGQMQKSFACMEIAAMLKRCWYNEIKGDVGWVINKE